HSVTVAAEGVAQALTSEDWSTVETLLLKVIRGCLETCLLASKTWDFPVDAPYLKAAQKVRRRTPYMPTWGNGSAAKTCEEAKAHWKQAKAKEKEMKLSEASIAAAWMDDVGGKLSLLWVVHDLVALCPWTSSMDAGSLMKYMQEECEETTAEMAALRTRAFGGRSWTQVVADLVAELGDVQFTLLLSLYIIARDSNVSPVGLIRTLTSRVCK
ncbi:unnamed protein product, partial [Symbiodinium pilosum]